jgi:uncharacterized protein (DUF1778 family)
MATPPRQSWNLRVSPEDQDLSDRAVSASGLTRTDFVLQAARVAAQELLVEQVWCSVPSEPFEAFRRLLDAPPNPSSRLQSTMASPSPSPLTMPPATLIAATSASTSGSSAVP